MIPNIADDDKKQLKELFKNRADESKAIRDARSTITHHEMCESCATQRLEKVDRDLKILLEKLQVPWDPGTLNLLETLIGVGK